MDLSYYLITGTEAVVTRTGINYIYYAHPKKESGIMIAVKTYSATYFT